MNLTSGQVQALIFSITLLIAIICIYKVRMNDQRPTGFCLFIFRLMHLSFGFLFFLMGILSLLSEENLISLAFRAAVIGFIFVALSAIFWHGKGCGTAGN